LCSNGRSPNFWTRRTGSHQPLSSVGSGSIGSRSQVVRDAQRPAAREIEYTQSVVARQITDRRADLVLRKLFRPSFVTTRVSMRSRSPRTRPHVLDLVRAHDPGLPAGEVGRLGKASAVE